jgi:hypothetical protein
MLPLIKCFSITGMDENAFLNVGNSEAMELNATPDATFKAIGIKIFLVGVR